MFTAIGFTLLIKILQPHPYIALDFDWFYRRPARLAYAVFVVPVNKLFGAVENGVVWLAHSLTRVSANPLGYIASWFKLEKKEQYQIMKQEFRTTIRTVRVIAVEPMVLIVIVIFVILLGVGLFRL